MSQAALSDACGIKQGSLSAIESGGSMPGADTIAKLARALSVTADYLLGLDAPAKPALPTPPDPVLLARAYEHEKQQHLKRNAKKHVTVLGGPGFKSLGFPVNQPSVPAPVPAEILLNAVLEELRGLRDEVARLRGVSPVPGGKERATR